MSSDSDVNDTFGFVFSGSRTVLMETVACPAGTRGHMASSGPLFVAADVAHFKIHRGPFSLKFTLPAAHRGC